MFIKDSRRPLRKKYKVDLRVSVYVCFISSQDFPAGGQIKSCKSTRRLSFWVINLGRFNMFNTCAI